LNSTTNNISEYNADILVESKLKQFFSKLLKDSKVSHMDDIKGIASWYGKKDKDRKGMVSKIIDKMGNELAEHITVPYVESLTNKLEFNTVNKEISYNNPIEIGLFDTDIHPYVEFGKVVNQVKAQSIKFKFHLNMVSRIKKITARRDGKDLVFDIQDLGVELKLMLIRIDIYSVHESLATNPLKAPISIGKSSFKIDHIVLSSKDKIKFAKTEQQTDEYSQTNTNGLICHNCNNDNPKESNFCNKCGSKIDLELSLSHSSTNNIKYDETTQQNNKFANEPTTNNNIKMINRYTSEGKPVSE
jgi:ribosomal protein L40E